MIPPSGRVPASTPSPKGRISITTVGVYGWTLERWLAALRDAGVALVADVRQRRGVRGSEYAWANATRLQADRSLVAARLASDCGLPVTHLR